MGCRCQGSLREKLENQLPPGLQLPQSRTLDVLNVTWPYDNCVGLGFSGRVQWNGGVFLLALDELGIVRMCS